MPREKTYVEQDQHALERLQRRLARERDPQERANLRLQIKLRVGMLQLHTERKMT